MIQKNDNLWKGILEDVFADFMRFIHPGVDEILDLDKGYEFLDKELAQVFPPDNDVYKPKMVDKLVKVYTRGGQEEWVLLHIEVQGRYEKDFGKRMFSYFYRLLDKYDKPIAAYAVFTEAIPKERPDVFSIAFMGTALNYRFNTYKITAPTDEELQENENPFAVVVLAARTVFAERHIKDNVQRDKILKELKFVIVRKLLKRKVGRNKEIAILNFIKSYIRFELKETNDTFDKELDLLTGKENTMGIVEQIEKEKEEEAKLAAMKAGIEQGIKQGVEQGKKEGENTLKENIVRNLAFNLGYTDQQIAEIVQVPLEFIRSIRV